MKQSLALMSIAMLSAVLLAGCGSTKELEASLAGRQASIDSLSKANRGLETENAKLKSRIGDLEKSLVNANARAADLQRQIDGLKLDLERSKVPAGRGGLDGAYRDALRMFMERRYEDAIAAFESLLAAGIRDPLNDNCHYWIGESMFGLKRYKEAVARFDEVLEFEWSNKKDDSQVMIARCYMRMGETARAKEEYRKLIDTYPASPYISLAKLRFGAM